MIPYPAVPSAQLHPLSYVRCHVEKGTTRRGRRLMNGAIVWRNNKGWSQGSPRERRTGSGGYMGHETIVPCFVFLFVSVFQRVPLLVSFFPFSWPDTFETRFDFKGKSTISFSLLLLFPPFGAELTTKSSNIFSVK